MFDVNYELSFPEAVWESTKLWLYDHGLTILIIIVCAWVVKRFGAKLISRVFRRTIRPDLYPTKNDRVKRIETLDSITGAIISVGVVVVAAIMILSEIGINTTPLIASAGIIGIALGFGAQSLVKDFSSGLFIIADNQYRVGDVVKMNGVGGVVEAITLRTTALRAFNGTLYHVPNGSIGVTANMTMNYGGLDEDIVFAQNVDLGKVSTVINRVGLDMAADQEFAKMIKEPPHFEWVSGFDSNGIKVKVIAKTVAGDSWKVRGEFYRRLAVALQKADLEVPFAQVVIHQADSDKPSKSKTLKKATRKTSK